MRARAHERRARVGRARHPRGHPLLRPGRRAQHFVFCPDNVGQGHPDGTLRSYAEQLVGVNSWGFWWD
ncbi:DUF4253 domain-containing protein [Microtetraspora malaysiensis]|uniref:DUF4253 domain-containing protein n=1 Tax=Microtetraspora malaysiensis TaxID=161358 RepID=UPI003D93A465